MKITLLHPSRGRAKKAYDTYNNWRNKCSTWENIQYVISLDKTDPQLKEYERYFGDLGLEINICVHDNKNVVEATNNAAPHARGEILIYLSDDFDCPKHWDLLIIDKAPKDSKQWLLKVDDCLQKFEVDVLTIPIMSKGLYERLGYFWHREYRSMFTDQDLFWTCKNLKCLIEAPELKFPHLHYSIGKTHKDETYKRSDSNWNQGKEVYHRRKKQNFPL